MLKVQESTISHRFFGFTEDLLCSRSVWNDAADKPKAQLFFYKAALRAVEAYQNAEYSAFDAHTTANCCHGIALLLRNLLLRLREIDLDDVSLLCAQRVLELENQSSISSYSIDALPSEVVDLTSLYILALAREVNKSSRLRTSIKKLKDMSQIGTKFCWRIIFYLQNHFSNIVISQYQSLVRGLDEDLDLCGVPIKGWAKYLENEYLRTDKRGTLYASCPFSTQVCLGYLSSTCSSVAVVNSVVDREGNFLERRIWLLKGDGYAGFEIASQEEVRQIHPDDPIVVFEGTSLVGGEDVSSWVLEFPHLILACDMHHHQFPRVSDDPAFDSSSIVPEEEALREVFEQHSLVEGVSVRDKSLFCTTHVHTVSFSQILEKECLPSWFIQLSY